MAGPVGAATSPRRGEKMAMYEGYLNGARILHGAVMMRAKECSLIGPHGMIEAFIDESYHFREAIREVIYERSLSEEERDRIIEKIEEVRNQFEEEMESAILQNCKCVNSI